MIVELLIGILIGVLFIDRFHLFVTLFPSLFDNLYDLIFSPQEKVVYNYHEEEEPDVTEHEKHVEIPICIDDSLTTLLETIFENYLDPIVKTLDVSKDFCKRVRQLAQHVFSDLCHRASKVDPKFLTYNALIPKMLYHFRTCKSKSYKNVKLIHEVYPTDEIHCGVLFNENDEDIYLKNLFESILVLSLPQNQQRSRIGIYLLRSVLTFQVFKPFIEYLSDPVNIKSIIFKALNSETVVFDRSVTIKKVPALRKFILPQVFKCRHVVSPPKDLRVTWSQLQTNPSLMYVFLQVLKNNARFIFPHFCIAHDEWMSKVAKMETQSGESKTNQIQSLIFDALKIYKMFILPESFHSIKFNKEIVDKIKELDFELYTEENLIKIQFISGILHNIAYKILTAECLDYFYHSSQFFMLCFGDKPKLLDLLTTYHIKQSRKVLGLQKQVTEPQKSDQKVNYEVFECDSDIESDIEDLNEAGSMDSNLTDQSHNIDLSQIRVKITDLKSQVTKNERIYFYVISVNKLNDKNEPSKIVHRTYKEFYTLENRLKRFHGQRIKNPLIPKRSFLMEKNFEYLRHCIQPFQDYLESLLKNEYLRYSSLLNSFFTEEEVMTQQSFFSRTTLVTGRAIQSMIGNLSIQKGKYIDGFLANFIASTEPPKPKILHKWMYEKLDNTFYPASIAQIIDSVNILLLSFCGKGDSTAENDTDVKSQGVDPKYLRFLNIESCHELLDLINNRELNKQLIYNLFDDIFGAIYPELTQSKQEASFDAVTEP
ncbi:Sorting nexin-14 [Thelohanellus kitauei]|uniref:Sorting nexin-14 n=1 Tax=Thelohanellus kitauei TaxID=669202 RepID=A0A0C2JDB1_THEKT|nr:Sorting nexin-14 [Thelohanellus kitauei]